MKLFLFGLFIGVLALVSPLAVSAADTLLVIGDSIGVGVASVLNPTKKSAVERASSATIAGYDGSGTFTHMVISAGSNDPTSANLEKNLRTIRAKQPNAKTVWILPYNRTAAATVRKAMSPGDQAVDLKDFPSADGVHPKSYQALGAAVKSALGTTAAPAQNAGGGANNAAGGGGASGPQYTSAVGAPREAGLVICGLNHDDPATNTMDETAPCTACHILLMGTKIIDWIRTVMVVIGIAVIFAMGVLYVVSAGNDKMIGIAKGGIKAALIGIAVILLAWLIVNTIIRMMGASGFFDGYFQAGTFSFTCDIASNAGTATSTGFGAGGAGGGGASSGGGQGGTSYTGAGKCQAVTNSSSNPCSTANLASSCFGGASVNAWSAICQEESSGNARIGSTTDKCADGNSASWGLFQINITANPIGGLNCPKAFSGGAYTASNKSCRVVDQKLFQDCVAAAQNATTNINKACQMSNNGTNTGPWGAARRCSIPVSL